jgi:hypothetical protein
MRDLQKMKRLSINDIMDMFPEVGKKEQALYIGMWKYVYDIEGNPIDVIDDGKEVAKNKSNVTHTIYYQGQYRDFDQYVTYPLPYYY